MTTPAPLPLATLDAVLERITYANDETGYTSVALLQRFALHLLAHADQDGGVACAVTGKRARHQGGPRTMAHVRRKG